MTRLDVIRVEPPDPRKLYLKGASGPLRGFSYLLCGDPNEERLKEFLREKYNVTSGDFLEFVEDAGVELFQRIHRIVRDMRDLETALCNFQKALHR